MEALSKDEIERYHRQLLLNELGLEGQAKIKQAKVLVVGAGGLGSPCLLYLAGAGVGTIGVLDHDTVEKINLHRQVLHPTPSVGIPKAESAKQVLQALNPEINIITYPFKLTQSVSADTISSYDILVIATDNLESRYLLSDLGVYYKKPVVSASALRWEGQLTVFPPSPCMRCYFPQPTPRSAWTRASDVGVLGPVPGVLGTLQATEVLKLILGLPILSQKMLIYDGIMTQFRVFKMRSPREDCEACVGGLDPHTYDYAAFFGQPATVPELPNKAISPEAFKKLLNQDNVEIVDVRNQNHFNICHIESSVNVPLGQLDGWEACSSNKPLVFVCKEGSDSARAVELCERKGVESSYLAGGLEEWKTVDQNFVQFI